MRVYVYIDKGNSCAEFSWDCSGSDQWAGVCGWDYLCEYMVHGWHTRYKWEYRSDPTQVRYIREEDVYINIYKWM